MIDKSPVSWMREALNEARLATEHGDVPIGAIVVIDNQIIARAHNEIELRHDATSHAEILAIQRASSEIGNWRLTEASIYVTLEPCPMCASAIVLARLKNLYFGAYDPRLGAVGSLFNLAEHSLLPHKVQVFPEVMAIECEELLKEFFAKLRAANVAFRK